MIGSWFFWIDLVTGDSLWGPFIRSRTFFSCQISGFKFYSTQKYITTSIKFRKYWNVLKRYLQFWLSMFHQSDIWLVMFFLVVRKKRVLYNEFDESWRRANGLFIVVHFMLFSPWMMNLFRSHVLIKILKCNKAPEARQAIILIKSYLSVNGLFVEINFSFRMSHFSEFCRSAEIVCWNIHGARLISHGTQIWLVRDGGKIDDRLSRVGCHGTEGGYNTHLELREMSPIENGSSRMDLNPDTIHD